MNWLPAKRTHRNADNQHGVGTVVLLIACFALVAIVGIGVIVYQHTRVTGASATAATQAADQQPSTADPYAGWQTAELSSDNLSFRYPARWRRSTTGDMNNVRIGTPNDIEVMSPIVNGHYFGVSLQSGPATTELNLNFLGSASGTTIADLTVPGSVPPLYVVAQDDPDPAHVGCLALATTPGNLNHATSFGILDDKGSGQHNIVMYACLTPVAPTLADSGDAYPMQAYTSNPYYQTVIKIFQSLRYN